MDTLKKDQRLPGIRVEQSTEDFQGSETILNDAVMLIHVLMHLLNSKESTGLPWWLSSKESTCNAGDMGSDPGWERSSGEGHGNPLQYSCLGNQMD